MLDAVQGIYSSEQVRYLVALIVANLALGIVASLRAGDFRLSRVADWLWSRVIPLLVGYGAAAFVAASNPSIAWLREAALVTLTGALLGYILSSFRDLGISLPDSIAGKQDDGGPGCACGG